MQETTDIVATLQIERKARERGIKSGWRAWCGQRRLAADGDSGRHGFR
jgi:hypothetical protein